MPINPNLLIAAPMLQDFLIDKDGTPMAGGIITLYQDNSRTTLKNWYYQSGTPGNYTYIALPNPLTLSAAGTITDVNGVDTIPFYYPFSENDQNVAQPYYITIVNHNLTNQITRANFPFNPKGNSPTPSLSGSLSNYIVNNRFWRNLGTVNLSSLLNVVVAPDQHDGFQFPDIQFFKNVIGSTDTLTFTKFPLTNTPILTGDITPEFYINHTCSAPTPETHKYYQFPISLHVNTLNGIQFTVTIQAQNADGTATGANVIGLAILQDTGTGTTPVAIPLTSLTLNTAWTKYQFTGVLPSTAGLVLSTAGNDALYLQVQMPLGIACSINFTLPSIYLSNTVPTNSFQTYDQIDPIINGFRTGDIRTSLNSFAPMGWVQANDGTIGNAASGANARANVDTWSLFSLLWNNVSDANAPVSGGRGASAFADWNANKTIKLTLTLSRVLGSVGPGVGLTNWALGQAFGSEAYPTTLSITNMPAHTHPGSTVALGISASSVTGPGAFNPATLGPTALNIASQGDGTPFNTFSIQPSVFYNVFFKL